MDAFETNTHPKTTPVRWIAAFRDLSGGRLGLALAVLYIFAAIGLSCHDFLQERKHEMDRIDASMRAASHALDQILGRDFHDRYTPSHPVPPDEFRHLTLELNRFASDLGVEYVYSMVRIGSVIHFVVSNETRDDTLRRTPSRFYNPYPAPPAELVAAFDADDPGRIHEASYTNIWDSFHSVFIPRTTPAGTRYVLAADIKLKDQRRILLRCVYRDAGLVLVLLLPMLPLVIFQRALIRTRQKIAAAEVAHREEVQEANRRLADLLGFSYTVSHDLRTPLNAISGYAEILREETRGRLADRESRQLDQIVEAAHRMSRMINTLLNLAKGSRKPLVTEMVDLDALAREVVGELADGGSDYGARFAIGSGLRLQADKTLLRLVLQNLLSNACKFSREKDPPQVELAGGNDGDLDWFEVRDNGEGFPPESAAQLFQPFERLHTGGSEGFGIGLATVRRLVEHHGGTIGATGTPGGGATFRVTWPRR